MTKVISVKFKEGGRSYFFDPNKLNLKINDSVIVETANGNAFGTVCSKIKEIDDGQLKSELKSVLRLATDADRRRLFDNKQKEKDAFKICERKIEEHKLEMKLVDVEYSFDGGKIIFFFTADGRVDFRELVKDLANSFHTRIELRQIGVRDEARMLGGIGICGQPYCCKRFLDDFQPVTIKMAKDQGLSLNPAKISGSCGRLMCCLKYEEDSYKHLLSITPSIGTLVKTPEGTGTVVDSNLISGELSVKPEDGEGMPFKTHRSRVKVLSKPRKGEKSPENSKSDK